MTEETPRTRYRVKTNHYERIAINFERSWRAGEGKQWLSAFYAAQIVGRYEKGKTKELARKISRDEDTVGELARAYITYRRLRIELRQDESCFRVIAELRKRLGYSHFAEAGRLRKGHDLTALDTFSMLQQAAENGISVKKMAEYVDGENGDSKPTEWTGQVKRTYAGLLNISTNGSAPDGLAKVAADCAKRLKVEAKKYDDLEL